MKAPDSHAAQGALAGLVAATALAAWFLLIDLVEGRPFYTPAFLYAVLTDSTQVEFGFRGIALYTLAHYAAFVVIGIGIAWFAERLEAVPGVLLGFILGFLLFDLIFYGSIWITGVDVVNAIGWPQVLAGNVIAGIVLMGSLSLFGPARDMSWREVLEEHRIIKEGLVAGLVGAGAVAVWFLLLDAVSGRVFFTPAALGSVAFHGARNVGDVDISALTVLGYTGFHLFAFIATGIIAAALATEAEESSEVVVLGAALLFVTLEAFFFGLLAILAQWLFDVIVWWSILIANLIAALAMGYYLWKRHPKLSRDFSERDFEDDLAHEEEEPMGVSGGRPT
ncbi:MAG: hypothetical protein ACRELD_05965 [Longimicrobiales bacterium]